MKKKGNPHRPPKKVLKRPKPKVSFNWGKIPKREHFCFMCGENKKLTVHHIKPRSEGGYSNKSNLMVLCERCHMKIHHPRFYNAFKQIYKELLKAKLNKI